jgi:hypothetical protein
LGLLRTAAIRLVVASQPIDPNSRRLHATIGDRDNHKLTYVYFDMSRADVGAKEKGPDRCGPSV